MIWLTSMLACSVIVSVKLSKEWTPLAFLIGLTNGKKRMKQPRKAIGKCFFSFLNVPFEKYVLIHYSVLEHKLIR